MLQPAGSQIAPPVFLHPASNSGFTQVVPRLFTFNPFVAFDLLLTLVVDAVFTNLGVYASARLLHGPHSLTVSPVTAPMPFPPPRYFYRNSSNVSYLY